MKEEYIKLIGRNSASSKNARQWTGKFLIKNKLSLSYEKFALPLLIDQLPIWNEMIKDKEPPYHVGFYYYRDSRRRWDFHNICALLSDLMVKASYIEDDNVNYFIPYYIGSEVVKKEKSGVKFKIIEKKDLLL